jgi:hypothetical protein
MAEENMKPDINEVILAIRDSFVGAEYVYKNGSCWYFANILKTIYPKGKIMESHDHAVFVLDGKYYDIEGEIHPEKYNATNSVDRLSRTNKFDLISFIRQMRGY